MKGPGKALSRFLDGVCEGMFVWYCDSSFLQGLQRFQDEITNDKWLSGRGGVGSYFGLCRPRSTEPCSCQTATFAVQLLYYIVLYCLVFTH